MIMINITGVESPQLSRVIYIFFILIVRCACFSCSFVLVNFVCSHWPDAPLGWDSTLPHSTTYGATLGKYWSGQLCHDYLPICWGQKLKIWHLCICHTHSPSSWDAQYVWRWVFFHHFHVKWPNIALTVGQDLTHTRTTTKMGTVLLCPVIKNIKFWICCVYWSVTVKGSIYLSWISENLLRIQHLHRIGGWPQSSSGKWW